MSFSEMELYLKKFHGRAPGCTSDQRSIFWTAQNKSTYEVLTDLVPLDLKTCDVLDIACGDGYLLEILQKRNQSGLQLHGIDMTEEELTKAQQRLAKKADLRLGRVQTLPFADQSMDYVFCHLALMLMNPVEEVVAEVARVLKPNGIFSAIISGPSSESTTLARYRELIRAELAAEGLDGKLAALGDPRLRKGLEIPSVFAKSFSNAVQVQVLDASSRLDLDSAVWHYMTFYGPDLLSAPGRNRLESNLRNSFQVLMDDDGFVNCTSGVIQLTVQK